MRKSVLVADDHAKIRKLFQKLLNLIGFDTILVENGKKALDVYKSNKGKISLIILDLNMPDMSGFDVYRKIVEMNPHERIIICSDCCFEQIPRHLYKYYIRKPFSLKGFVNTLRRVLNLKEEEIQKNNEEMLEYTKRKVSQGGT